MEKKIGKITSMRIFIVISHDIIHDIRISHSEKCQPLKG